MAALASSEAGHRPAALPGHRRALAHPGRPANPDQGHPIGNHPTLGNVHGFWYFYFRQRALSALFGHALPARLQQAALCRLLAAASGLALPLEPLRARAGGRGLEDPPQLAAAPAPTTPARLSFWTLTSTYFAAREDAASYVRLRLKFRARTIWLLSLFSGFIAALLFALHQPGVLHLPGLAAAAHPDRRQCWPGSRRIAVPISPGAAGGKPLLSTAWLTGAQAVFAGSACWPRRPGLGAVGVAQPAVRLRHRHPAGAPRRGRLHALDVPPLRPDRTLLCRAAPACGAGRHCPAGGPAAGLAAAAQGKASGRHSLRWR
jgi:hypothetical protein